MKERTWLRVRKPVLLSAAGLVVLGLIVGVSVYESIKGGGVTMTRDREAVAAERMAVPPPIDASRPQRIETATFALG